MPNEVRPPSVGIMDVGVRGSLDFMRTDYLVVSEDSLPARPPLNSPAGGKKLQHDYLTPAKICQNIRIMLFLAASRDHCALVHSNVTCVFTVDCFFCVLMFVDVWPSDFERIDK